MSTKMLTRSFLVMCACLFASPCPADLVSASKAYAKGDYAKAFAEFRELAEIGQPTAQYNVAVMYAKGQGTRQSDIYAYAWASLAATNGLDRAKTLADALRPNLAPGSEGVAADIAAHYSNAVLDAQINPLIMDTTQDKHPCRLVHAYVPDYPEEAQHRGMEGIVYAEFTVMPDGRARNPRIVYALPVGFFERTMRTSIFRSQFMGAAAGQPAANCQLMFKFDINADLKDYSRLHAFADETLTKAQQGDAQAQFMYGMLLDLPQLKKPHSDALPWFLKSAQTGLPEAQYQVGHSLLVGRGCQCQETKGVDWMRRAARGGQTDAEVTLAMYTLKGTPDTEQQRAARLWLEQATASGNQNAKLYLAALLAAAPDGTVRDPKAALKLLDEVFRYVDDDPTAYEVRAAGQANSGQFEDAVRSQRKALAMATSLKWDPAPLAQRLSRYEAQQPWTGMLVEY